MGRAEEYAAEGKAYASAARRKEEEGEVEHARDLYIKASKKYLQAAKASAQEDDKKLRVEFSKIFYQKALSLKTKASAIPSASAESAGEIVPIERPNINFSNVAGLESVKEEIKKTIIYPLKHPEIFERYKKRVGEGILMYGPPGCGKTFIAKAAAGECNVPFITLRIGDILSKWFGESEKNIKLAFESARKYQPSILFFDEIDAIGARRDVETGAIKRVVNALLIELDGVTSSTEKGLVLAATNAPWDVDPALRRPGRFSKLLFIPPPDFPSRVQLFKLYTEGRPLADDVNFERLANETEWYSCADIAQVCEEAADIPLMEVLSGGKPRKIEMADFLEVLRKRKSSLIPWFRLAKNQIQKSGEEDLFSNLLQLADSIERQALT